MTDYLLWSNDIENRFSPSSLTHVAEGSGYIATAVISSVTTNSSYRLSLWDAYKDLREKLLDGDTTLLPESTTTQRDALTNIVNGTLMLNITTGREEICSDTDWVSVSGFESNTSGLNWASKDTSGIQSTKTHIVQPWSSTSGLTESGTPDLGDQVMMVFPGTAQNLYVAVTTAAGSTETHTFTIEKNGVDQSVEVILNNTLTGNDLTNSFTFVAGDLISLKIVGSDGCANSGKFTVGLEFV